jgi:hypothetical protein
VDRVMEIVAPLGIQIVASLFHRSQEDGIIQIAFRDDVELATHPAGNVVRYLLNRPQERTRTAVFDGVHGIRPKAVTVEDSSHI